MASAVEENNVEYDSDPEEAKRPLTMRRCEASDDEETEREESTSRREDRRVEDRSDDEGGVEDYDDVEEVELEEEKGEEEEEEVEDGVSEEKGASGVVEVEGSVNVIKESDGDVRLPWEDSVEDHSEEKKENEPFAVPTAGTFYMHDDRFRDNAAARHRRIQGGRRLWESKDDRKWGHDKFEEITFHEMHHEERRRPSKGNYRGHAKSQRNDHGGYVRGNRKGYDNSSNNQNQVPKSVVRGRGPQRYERTNKSNGPSSQVQNKLSGKSLEKTSNVSLERTFTPASNAESDPMPAKSQVLASNLNYASPPFYPSGSSNKDSNLAQKREVQMGGSSRNSVNSVSMEKLHIDKSIPPPVGNPLNNVHMAPPGSSGVNAQSSHVRASGTGRGVSIPVQMNYLCGPSQSKGSQTQHQAIQKRSVPSQNSTPVQATIPQLDNKTGSGTQSSSPSKTSMSINSNDSGEMDATSESSKANGALVGKGRGGSQGAGRGSFVYGGAQVMGTAANVGVSHGDPNFPGFLPVMQFGGQHPGGIGVPAVGMAFPGYVAQPQLGLGKSEMTWFRLPVLAGATGALGATYCPPYLAVDGASTEQSGQASTMSNSSKEQVNKANNELKPPQRSEPANDESRHQNKPRRYSEMNFGQ